MTKTCGLDGRWDRRDAKLPSLSQQNCGQLDTGHMMSRSFWHRKSNQDRLAHAIRCHSRLRALLVYRAEPKCGGPLIQCHHRTTIAHKEVFAFAPRFSVSGRRQSLPPRRQLLSNMCWVTPVVRCIRGHASCCQAAITL